MHIKQLACVPDSPIFCAHSHADAVALSPQTKSVQFCFSSKGGRERQHIASGGQKKEVVEAMVLDSILSSPRMRSPSFRRQFTKDEPGSWSTLVQRHRFLLSALVLLSLLCTVYLYFAVTLGASGSCSGLSGAQKASCHMEHVKDSMAKGKMKIL